MGLPRDLAAAAEWSEMYQYLTEAHQCSSVHYFLMDVDAFGVDLGPESSPTATLESDSL